MNLRRFNAPVLLGLAWCAVCTTSFAANFTVQMRVEPAVPVPRWVFSPTNINISAGDSITWTNVHATAHDSTHGIPDSGTGGLWASPLLQSGTGQTFAFTFANTGFYPYRCRTHADAGGTHPEQTGSVSVATAPMPPTVMITNPANGAVFPAPATVLIQASASDTGGSVANVEFFNGVSSLGIDTTAPYSASTPSLGAGNYTLRAVATDNSGLKATNSISITVNAPPVVAIQSPTNGAVLSAPATFIFSAFASDTSPGTVTSVEFQRDGTSLGSDPTSPYSINVNALGAGSYVLRAIATDNNGAKASNSISITVNALPTVQITNPTNGAVIPFGSTFLFSANAGDTGGTISQVEFLDGAVSLGVDPIGPGYSINVSNISAGPHTLNAVATDNLNGKATNSVNITVTSNQPPSVMITNPLAGASFRAGSNVQINVVAADPDGSITMVELLTNGAPAGSLSLSNASFSLAFAAGNLTLTARATDNLSAQSTSAPVSIFILTNAVLTNFLALTNGQTQFDVFGITGQTYFIDATSDLSNWTGIATNLATNTLFRVTDPTAPGASNRFYRSRQLAQ